MGHQEVTKAAKHKFACRVLQRLFEYCRPTQTAAMVQILLADAVALCKHRYGNYVMQHVLEHGTESWRREFAKILERKLGAVGTDVNGGAVLGKAFAYATHEDQVSLATGLVSEPGLLVKVARTRYGHGAVKIALQLLSGSGLADAQQQLLAEADSLRLTRYGRSVLGCLESLATCGEAGRAPTRGRCVEDQSDNAEFEDSIGDQRAKQPVITHTLSL